MLDINIIVLFVAVFIISYTSMKFWETRAKKAGLVGKDIHKLNHPEVSEMGGIAVIFSFIVGAFIYTGMRVFLFNTHNFTAEIFAIVLAVVLGSVIGIVDDILGWKIGLSQWQKPILTLLVAFPVMAVDAGVRIMHFPFFGQVNLGLFYPLIVIPGFILVGTNGTNMLAGFNELEASIASLIIASLGFVSYKSGYNWVAALCMIMLLCIFCFWLFFNRFPAKLFPGDTFTYGTGAFIAAVAIFANLEKMFLILIVPLIVEFFMKARGRFKKESFAKLKEDGSLTNRYDKLYGLEHLVIYLMEKMKIRVTERKIVYFLVVIQLVFVVLAFVL